ncbi:MAG: hypothetical protein ACKO6L_11680, partial [Flavobacteriales bacterium]
MITKFFNEFDEGVLTPDSGGEELHFNYLVQSQKLDEWLDYRFQAIWIYEVAWKFPFLYEEKNRKDPDLVKNCVLSSLFANYFVHFAGPWHESQLWKINDLFKEGPETSMFSEFFDYLTKPV